MHEGISFSAIIEANDSGGDWVAIPFDVEAHFGSKRPRIKAQIEGVADYRGTLVRMGTPHHILVILKSIREQLGKQQGDVIHITLWPDTEERTVDIPVELSIPLAAAPALQDVFRQLSYTHQKEYVQYITEAKRPETRVRRVQKVLDMLQDKLTK